MKWEPEKNYRSGQHVRAMTAKGEYIAGPRRSDGCWEYMTPSCQVFGDHDMHVLDDLTEAQAKAACERHLKEPKT